MTADDDAATLERERPALRGLAYRMLGSLSDAEDAVQEAFMRWMRLEDAKRAAIENPGAWMMRVTSRICLDMLGSARVRRESYVGPWLPEPVPAFADPARSRHDAVAAAFAAATDAGDVDALVSLLDPAVTLTSDGGGKVSAARRPVHGADRVARFLLGALTKHPGATVEPIATDDGLGFRITEHGKVNSVMVLGVRGERVTEVWLVRNPEKLTRWR